VGLDPAPFIMSGVPRRVVERRPFGYDDCKQQPSRSGGWAPMSAVRSSASVRRVAAVGFIALLTVFASACGGGGGTAPSPTLPPTPPPPPPPPPPQPSSPVVQFAGAQSAARLDETSARAFAADLQSTLRIINELPRGLGVSVLGITQLDLVMNGPGGGTADRTAVLNGGVGWYSSNFHDYVDYNGKTYNGRFTQLMPSTPQLVEWTAEFTALRVTDANSDRRVTGSVHEAPAVSGQANETVLVANLVVEDLDAGDSVWADGVTITLTRAGLVLEETTTGRFYRSADGYVDLSSDGAQIYNGRAYPEEGGTLYFDGANAAGGLVPLPARYFAIVLDADHDGEFERFARLSWDSFLTPAGRATPYVDTHSRAIANAGTSRSLAPGDTAVLEGVLSHDADGSFLAGDWTLAIKPAGSTATLARSDARARLTPDVEGEYLLKLHVHDPDGDAYDSVLLTAGNPAGDFRMYLDRPPPVPLGTAVTLDASMSRTRQSVADVHWHWALKAPPGSGAALTSTSMATTSLLPDVAGFYALDVDDDFTSFIERTVSFGLDFDFERVAHLTTTLEPFGRPIVADFDGDGDADLASLAVVSGTEVALAFYENLGDHEFAETLFALGAVVQSELTSGDLDGNGLLDTVAAWGTTLLIARGGASPKLETMTLTPSTGCTGGELTTAIADANADGRDDLIVTDGCSKTVTVWLQGLTGALGPAATHPVPELGTWSVAIGDLNHDDRADLAISGGAGDQIVHVVLATSGGGYSLARTFTDVPAYGMLITDMNGDGLPDLLLGEGLRVTVVAQLPNGTLGAPEHHATGGGIPWAPLSAGDIDGNGLPDVFISDTTAYGIGLQRSVGTFEFVWLPVPQLATPWHSTATVADLDGDGRPDLVRDPSGGVGFEVWLGAPR
jgi:FG-GAP-like repeat